MNKRSRWGPPAVVARVFLWLLLPALVAALQLPPDIQADRYLMRAQRQIEEQDFAGAKESLEQILVLQSQHGLEVPEEFYLHYAEVLERLELYDEAITFATKYLTLAGRGGEHYRAALELLDKAELAMAAAEAAAAAAAAAARRKPGESRVFDGMEFAWVPAGEFRMGSTSVEAEPHEQPVTQVLVSRGFWLGRYEVTQSEWQAVSGMNPSESSGCGRCPVESISWHDVKDFIDRLNARSGATNYRLPTEAEWEYAARAGVSEDRYSEDLDAIAWYDGNSEKLQPVGRKKPNAWGLHDMLGNVSEWVQDWYGDYPGGTLTDPQGPFSARNGCSGAAVGGTTPRAAGHRLALASRLTRPAH